MRLSVLICLVCLLLRLAMRLAGPGTFKHSTDHIGDDCAHETADAGYSTPHSTKQP